MIKNKYFYISKPLQKQSFLKIFIFSSVTVLLLCLSFPPVDFYFLSWFALVPWFIAILVGGRYVYPCALFTGLMFFLVELSWLRYITVPAWVLLSSYCAVYFLIFTFIARLLIFCSGWPFTIVSPCVWTMMEFVRSFLFSGFPWFFVGHTQYRCLPVVQVSDITGVYGVTFIIILVNACITDLFICSSFRGGFKPLSFLGTVLERPFTEQYCRSLCSYRKSLFIGVTCAVPIVLVIAALSYGFLWLKGYESEEGPRICVVQGNIPQDLKFEPNEEEQIQILKKHADLSADVGSGQVDLVVWPETMVPGLLNIDPELTGRKIDVLSQLTAAQLAQNLNANMLLGGIALVLDGEEQTYYNSAYYYNRAGVLLGRYDKIHLVPFGEFTPLKRYFPFLAYLVPYEIGLTHGHERTLFQLDTSAAKRYTFGSSICYEDTVPSLIRGFKRDGADFMLNITNDGWFNNSAELDQHLAIMVFRAIENRICMVRAANTGISSFVSPDGTIYKRLTDREGRYKGICGTLVENVKLARKHNTFYASYGDWFPLFCTTVPGVAFIIAIRRRLSP